MNRKEIEEAKKEAVRKALQSVDAIKTTEGLCWYIDEPWCIEPPFWQWSHAYAKTDAMRRVLRSIGAVCNAHRVWYLP